MAFTRFHDDPCRIKKQLQESTGPGLFMIDVPGNGLNPCFMEDPFVRMQKWGANLQTNVINLESDLRGMTRGLNRDELSRNNYADNTAKSEQKQFPSCNPFTEQSRATHPAWHFRDLEQNNFQYLPLNPQENVCIPFQNNLSTRILEKDHFLAEVPCIPTQNGPPISSQPYAATSKTHVDSLCTEKNTCGKVNKK